MKIKLVLSVFCLFLNAQASLTERLDSAHEKILNIRNNIKAAEPSKSICTGIICASKCKPDCKKTD